MIDKESAQSSSPDALAALSGLSTDLLVAAFEMLPDAVFLFNDRMAVGGNKFAAQLQGCSAAQLQAMSCCQMFWRSDGADQCVVDRALETGVTIEVELSSPADDRPMVLTVNPFCIDERGRYNKAIVVARDISALRNAEAEALTQKSFVASIADLTPDEIYSLDGNGRITWMNKRAECANPLMLAGRFLIEFIVEHDHEIMNGVLKRTLAGEECSCELLVLNADGTLRDAEVNTCPVWKDGEVEGSFVFLRDVTERKAAQELLSQSDKLRAVGELAAGVAHNLNNSLTVIQGRAQLLLRKVSDEAVVKSLEVITKAVEEGSQTLRRILEFARRDSTQEFRPVELNDLITSSVEIARPKWQRKSANAAIKIVVACNEPVYVIGELAELREVVLNLIFNAVDAMPEGGNLEVGTRAEIDTGCFWVADTGCGMSPETAARIFEPFFTTKGKSGTGLGLSASHGIIVRHGGEIVVVSEPGEGTRFEVRLPICDLQNRLVKKSESPEEQPEMAMQS